MASEARIDSSEGKPILAENLTVTEARQHTFFCRTPGCGVRMFPYALESSRARFNSQRGAEHMSSACRQNIHFGDHEYAEDLFDRGFFAAFERNARRRYLRRMRQREAENPVVVNPRNITPADTTYEIYKELMQKDIGDTYNGIPVDDLLVCYKNFDGKRNGFAGGCVVEATFWDYREGKDYILFNLCRYNSLFKPFPHLRVIFHDGDERASRYFEKHFRDRNRVHSRLVIIAGEWEQCDDTVDGVKVISQVTIYSERQFKFLE